MDASLAEAFASAAAEVGAAAVGEDGEDETFVPVAAQPYKENYLHIKTNIFPTGTIICGLKSKCNRSQFPDTQ